MSEPDKLSEGGLLERTVTHLFFRAARITRNEELTPNFHLIDLQGDDLKECTWAPGDKVQVKLDRGMVTRTYTPLWWDREKGVTQLLAYTHGNGPGSDWARRATSGDERQFFGPRRSISVDGLGGSTILFGDETSFALALALEENAEPRTRRHYVFEVNDKRESGFVLSQLGLPDATLIERDTNNHLSRVAEEILAVRHPMSMFILTGSAASIQHIGRTLKVNDVGTRQLRTKAYWAQGKIGLD